MATEGFSKIRNGLKEHIEAGKLCPTDLGVYTFLHLYCDYSTGIYKGTALGIAYRMGDATHKSTINKSLARLKKMKFINFRAGNGKRGGYEILIDKFEPTFGELRGCRLNAWKSGANGRPIYEAGTVEERSRSGEGTVEARSGHGRGTVEERITNIQTVQTGKTVHTTTDNTPSSSLYITPPIVPTESLTGGPSADVQANLDLVAKESEPVPPFPTHGTPPASELSDIRDWNTPAFGFSAELLRNSLIQVLDYREDDYYRRNPPTVDSMNRENFVRKLVRDAAALESAKTPPKPPTEIPGWSGQTYKVNEVTFE